ISLLSGLLSRVAAAAIIAEMIGAILTVHIHFGFFMNWVGDQKGEGFEYHLITIALAFLIMARGAGAQSIDYLITVLSRGLRQQQPGIGRTPHWTRRNAKNMSDQSETGKPSVSV